MFMEWMTWRMMRQTMDRSFEFFFIDAYCFALTCFLMVFIFMLEQFILSFWYCVSVFLVSFTVVK